MSDWRRWGKEGLREEREFAGRWRWIGGGG